jgi:hypothetical protein
MSTRRDKYKVHPAAEPRQVGEVSKGSRGKVDTTKAKAVAEAEKHGISKRTVTTDPAK